MGQIIKDINFAVKRLQDRKDAVSNLAGSRYILVGIEVLFIVISLSCIASDEALFAWRYNFPVLVILSLAAANGVLFFNIRSRRKLVVKQSNRTLAQLHSQSPSHSFQLGQLSSSTRTLNNNNSFLFRSSSQHLQRQESAGLYRTESQQSLSSAQSISSQQSRRGQRLRLGVTGASSIYRMDTVQSTVSNRSMFSLRRLASAREHNVPAQIRVPSHMRLGRMVSQTTNRVMSGVTRGPSDIHLNRIDNQGSITPVTSISQTGFRVQTNKQEASGSGSARKRRIKRSKTRASGAKIRHIDGGTSSATLYTKSKKVVRF